MLYHTIVVRLGGNILLGRSHHAVGLIDLPADKLKAQLLQMPFVGHDLILPFSQRNPVFSHMFAETIEIFANELDRDQFATTCAPHTYETRFSLAGHLLTLSVPETLVFLHALWFHRFSRGCLQWTIPLLESGNRQTRSTVHGTRNP